MILASLINNNGNLRKCYLFIYRHIFKTAFLRKMYITSKSYDRFFPNFSKQASELSSFTSASLKAIVTVGLAAQNAGNTSVKADIRIEVECRQTISPI